MSGDIMSTFYTYGPLLFMVLFIYFLVIRPQRKEQKRRKDMLDSLKKGARVMTVGGLYGTIAEIREDTILLRIAEHVEIEVAKASINQNLASTEK